MADCAVTEPAAPTTLDDFLGGKLVIEQPARGFRAGLDAVLLAAAVKSEWAGAFEALDAGAGVGTAGLCLAARLPAARVTLVERSADLADLARRNVERNGLAERARVVPADIADRAAALEIAGIAANAFDVVIANPPYLETGRHRLPQDPTAADAFGMAPGALDTWLKFMARAAKADGCMAMIHRADALGDILAAIGERFGALCILPIHPREGEPAHRIIVKGRKGSRAPLTLLPGLVLHGAGNSFLPAVQGVLRDGTGLMAPHRKG